MTTVVGPPSGLETASSSTISIQRLRPSALPIQQSSSSSTVSKFGALHRRSLLPPWSNVSGEGFFSFTPALACTLLHPPNCLLCLLCHHRERFRCSCCYRLYLFVLFLCHCLLTFTRSLHPRNTPISPLPRASPPLTSLSPSIFNQYVILVALQDICWKYCEFIFACVTFEHVSHIHHHRLFTAVGSPLS